MGPEVEFVRDVAICYPLRVVMVTLGEPEEDGPRMLQLTQELFGADDPELRRGEATPEDRDAAGIDFIPYLTRHVAFGHGAHHCPAHLPAQMELRHLYLELFRRVERNELVGEPRPAHSIFVGGLKTLPIRFRPK